MENSILIILQLLLAHIITDFVIQPAHWIKSKQNYKARSKYLYLHAFLAGLLTYLFLMRLEMWYIGVFVGVTHFFIDLWKLYFKNDNLKIFLADQLLHVLVIVIAWLFLTSGFSKVFPFILELLTSRTVLAVVLGYLLIIFPTGFLIGKVTKRWQDEVEDDLKKNSLDAAGRYIGIFERILVLTFILTLNFSAIGFLIAAKSILRFSDKSETGARKQTEYVLIGTLMSFTITILIGLLVNHIAF